jgi:signal transduction histidine kinase
LLLLVFSLALAAPLGYLILRTHASLERDEAAELRFFAETLFNQMEEELALLVQKEEARAVEDYSHPSVPPSLDDFARTGYGARETFVGQSYILGYLQNNQDGQAHIAFPPWASLPAGESLPSENQTREQNELRARLQEVNDIFNRKRANIRDFADVDSGSGGDPFSPPPAKRTLRKDEDANVADKYLQSARQRKSKVALGQEKRRVVGITPNQAQNLAPSQDAQHENRPVEQTPQLLAQAPIPAPVMEAPPPAPPKAKGRAPVEEKSAAETASRELAKAETASIATAPPSPPNAIREAEIPMPGEPPAPAPPLAGRLPGLGLEASAMALEIDPLQSVVIDADTVFIYRRIVLGNAVFRQGFVLQLSAFLNHLGRAYFQGQPMARFTNLNIEAQIQGKEQIQHETGVTLAPGKPRFLLKRQFPRPFAFLNASLACNDIPRSEGRDTLYIMILGLAAVILAGLAAIYKSAAVVVDLSERRSGFVSSVTHELKTPLTTLRLYIEMLQHGVASSKEQEREYLRILNAETSRLSRLIHNVLEFSRLERKQRNVNLRVGDFEDVLREVLDVLREKLRQEGFELSFEREDVESFAYDREAMIQILINCIDNSVKFGADALPKEIRVTLRRRGERIELLVSDSGPGIPRHALKKVFDDFYRVDSSLTRKTQGTGIGLSLVRQLTHAMGGRVRAANNTPGPGCTITVDLPYLTRVEESA